VRRPLTARGVAAQNKPGFHADGTVKGLFLVVTPAGAKSWRLRFQLHGRRRDMALGSAALVTLAEARAAALDARRLIANRVDQLEERRRADAARRRAAGAITFAECAEAYITEHEAAWRNRKHRQQWRNTLRDYAYPVFGDQPVAAVDFGMVLASLQPIWRTKTETATRLRGRIESILDFAVTHGWRPGGDNPARWRGHLENVLANPAKITPVKHRPALHYRELPCFLSELHRRDGIAAKALEFTVLTAARVGEVIGARWSEFNMAERVWIVPAQRMKAGKEHRVPLSDAALCDRPRHGCDLPG